MPSWNASGTSCCLPGEQSSFKLLVEVASLRCGRQVLIKPLKVVELHQINITSWLFQLTYQDRGSSAPWWCNLLMLKRDAAVSLKLSYLGTISSGNTIGGIWCWCMSFLLFPPEGILMTMRPTQVGNWQGHLHQSAMHGRANHHLLNYFVNS